MTKSCTAILLLVLAQSTTAFASPAFPGAEGSAADAVGGRGGAIYIVDTISDDGSDGLTFREACEATGPRIVVFAVSGWIDLQSKLEISNDDITIAGQTSPGGVGVRGEPFRISANEVVITHMRFAAGSMRGEERDSLQVWGPADNVMIDHSSIRWGCDESGETAYNPLRVTISWSVIGPGLYNCAPEGNHNFGFLVWGGNDTHMTFHHNFFPHNRYRNPEINGGLAGDAPKVDLVNNVAFDTFGGYTGFHSSAGSSRANVVHNWFQPGSSNNPDAREGIIFGGESSAGDATYYVVGNAGAWRLSSDDSRAGHMDWDSLKTTWNGVTPHMSWRRTTPHVFPGIPVTRTDITSTYASVVVAGSGATRPVIDSADATYKSDYESGVHAFLDGDLIGNSPESYPTLEALPALVDSDADGMADTWESDRGLDVGADDSAGDDDGDGYTNVEEYLHVLGGYAAGPGPRPMDGGTPDGGVGVTDGGVGVTDAGVESDGGSSLDAGPQPDAETPLDGGASADSGRSMMPSSGGCSIDALGRDEDSIYAPLGVFVVGLLVARRRRNRSR